MKPAVLGYLACLMVGTFASAEGRPPPARDKGPTTRPGDSLARRDDTKAGPVMLFPIVKDGKWGYMDQAGKVAIEPQYQAAYDFSEGLACVMVNGWRGFVDQTGAMVIKPKLAWAGPFREGFAPVYNSKGSFGGRPQFYRPSGGNFCCIDRSGKATRFACSTAGFREGKTVVRGKNCYGTDGQKIEHDAEELYLFSEGLAGARKGPMWGYLDHSMSWAIRPQFHAVDQFSEGLAGVAKADVPPPETGSRWQWLKKAKLKWGFCDKSGKVVIDYRFEDAWPFAEELAAVQVGGKWGYIDKAGAMSIEPGYDHAWPFSEGLARVLVGEKQGFIDRQGEMVIQPQYQPAWEFSKGLARVTIDGKEGYINHEGEYVRMPTK